METGVIGASDNGLGKLLKEYNEGKIQIYEGGIQYDGWVKTGFGSTNRKAMPINSPNYIYNYLESFGIVPEEYGIIHPIAEKYAHMDKSELMVELTQLELEIENYRSMFG